MSKEIESVAKTCPQRKTQNQMVLLMNSTEELKPIFHKLFQKDEDQGTLPNSSYGASIEYGTLVPKTDNDTIRKGNYRPISPM